MSDVNDEFVKEEDPRFHKVLMPFLQGLWDHYFRCEMDGWDHVPEGKALFVGNHNGILTFEVLMMFYAWRQQFGKARKALGLAHGIVLTNPFLKWLLPRIGAIPANPAIADRALQAGYSLLVYPGGERESFRPFTERRKVDFFGRKGFIKLALRNKVPIIPIVSIGAHETYIIFDRGEELAEKLGLKEKYRLHGLPITVRSVFFMWCMATGVFTFFPLLIAPFALISVFIPLPAKMTFKILEPIYVADLYDASKTEEENLDFLYQLVIGRIQETLSREYDKRTLPILG